MWQDVGAPALPRTAESSADRADEDDVDVVDDDDDDGEEVRVPATTASSLCSLAIILCATRKEKEIKNQPRLVQWSLNSRPRPEQPFRKRANSTLTKF